VTTHFTEDVARVTTKCGITLSENGPNEDYSSNIVDCTCPQCLSLAFCDSNKRLQITHFVKDAAEMSTICGLVSLKDGPHENTSLNINDCTCPQCLSLIICDLTKRLQNINRAIMLQMQCEQNKPNDDSNL
jgi:hypothetical protein